MNSSSTALGFLTKIIDMTVEQEDSLYSLERIKHNSKSTTAYGSQPHCFQCCKNWG